MKTASALTIAACLLALSATPARAQAIKGLIVGVSGSQMVPAAEGQEAGMRPGLTIGGFVGGHLIGPVSLEVEALYAQKHSKVTVGSREDTTNLDYFQVPILANMALFKGLRMLEGVGIGFPVHAKFHRGGSAELDVKDLLSSPDISLIIGVVFPAGPAEIEFRYDGGFTKIEDRESAGTQRNRSYGLNVRIPF